MFLVVGDFLKIRIGKRMEIKATYYYYVGTPTPLNWSQRLLLYYKIITILLMLSTILDGKNP